MESLFYLSTPQLRNLKESKASPSSSNAPPSAATTPTTTHSTSHHQIKDFLKGRSGSYSSRSTPSSPRNNSSQSLSSLQHYTAPPADIDIDRMPDSNGTTALNKASQQQSPQSSQHHLSDGVKSASRAVRLPTKHKKYQNYQYTSNVWSAGGVAVGDRKYSPRPPQTADGGVAGGAGFGGRSMVRSNSAAARTNSVSSASGTTGSSTNISGVPGSKDSNLPHPAASSETYLIHPFVKKNGRRYLRDPSIPYPLPCDLSELHRQILRTELLVQVFGGPICATDLASHRPKKILEVGCGTGYWSALCHKYFAREGHIGHFTGIDLVPVAIDLTKYKDMQWKFVQHDIRRLPLPFQDDEFDFIMLKDMGLVTPYSGLQQSLMDEYLRILQPEGTLEIWEGDNTLRMLLPNTPSQVSTPIVEKAPDEGDDFVKELATTTGTYNITSQTSLTAPQNQHLIDYNTWITKGLESKGLTAVPCTNIQPMLLQETEDLADIENRRLAIPLGDIRWEHDNPGDPTLFKESHESSSSAFLKGKRSNSNTSHLTPTQMAVRQTALQTLVQMIEGMEPLLREASGKGQDEWDRWMTAMMNDLMVQNGASWGECLEVGAWWARKKSTHKAKHKDLVVGLAKSTGPSPAPI